MKVLISAYACEPAKGSEPVVGWTWALAAAREHDVWVLTRSNNREVIEAAAPPANLRFVYVDLPAAARRWKRGHRGARLYYLLWQLLAAREARRLHAVERFDVVHHLTFANLFLPALVFAVPVPFVLGPVAGGQRVPRSLYRELGVRSTVAELALRAGRLAARLSPFVRAAWSRAAVVLVNNEETIGVLPRRHRVKAVVRPNAAALHSTPLFTHAPLEQKTALVPGRLNRFKGVGLAIRALASAPDWRLVIAGAGDDAGRLSALARRLGVEDRVRFAGHVSREELWHLYSEASAVVLPSLKEGASLVCVEALALGVPVIALDQGGPRALAQFTGVKMELVPVGSRAACAGGIAAALARVRPTQPLEFGLDAVARDLSAAYARAVATRPAIAAAEVAA
jgi:glycosyltransferase involved in cell wall biosynthesis